MHVCTSLRSFCTFYPMNVSILDLLSQSATPVCTSTQFWLFFCSFSVFCGSFSFLFLVVVYFYTLAFSCNNFELLYCHFVALFILWISVVVVISDHLHIIDQFPGVLQVMEYTKAKPWQRLCTNPSQAWTVWFQPCSGFWICVSL